MSICLAPRVLLLDIIRKKQEGKEIKATKFPWIKRKTLLVHFLISGYLSTPLCHENQVYKHFPFDYIPSPYLGRFLEAVQRAGKGRNVHSHCSSHQLQLFWKKYISSRKRYTWTECQIDTFLCEITTICGNFQFDKRLLASRGGSYH